jgi:hypothetical protein
VFSSIIISINRTILPASAHSQHYHYQLFIPLQTSKLHSQTNHHARHIPLRNHRRLERNRLRGPSSPSCPPQGQRVQQRRLVSPPRSPPLLSHFNQLTTSPKQRPRHRLLRAPQQLQPRRDHGRHFQLRLLRFRALVLLQRQVGERRRLHWRAARQVGQRQRSPLCQLEREAW